jgi:hypothetical protein
VSIRFSELAEGICFHTLWMTMLGEVSTPSPERNASRQQRWTTFDAHLAEVLTPKLPEYDLRLEAHPVVDPLTL